MMMKICGKAVVKGVNNHSEQNFKLISIDMLFNFHVKDNVQ